MGIRRGRVDARSALFTHRLARLATCLSCVALLGVFAGGEGALATPDPGVDYAFSPAPREPSSGGGIALDASNAAHGFRVRLAGGEARFANVEDGDAVWEIGLSYAGGMEQVTLEAAGSRVGMASEPGGLTGEFINGPSGLELRFTLDSPPAGEGETRDRPRSMDLGLDLAESVGLRYAAERATAAFFIPGGPEVLHLSPIGARTLAGKVIPVWLEIVGDGPAPAPGLRVFLDATGPEYYPLTFSLLARTPKAEVFSQRDSRTLEPGSSSHGFDGPIAPGGDSPFASAGVPPPHDECSGAEIIPGGGPFPHLTALIPDISAASATGDPPLPRCQPNVSRSVWYTFTPLSTGAYTISTCSSAPTGTTVSDTVLAVYTSLDGTCAGGMIQATGGCDDDGCTDQALQAVLWNVELEAGTTYFILAWKFGADPPASGRTALQLRVSTETPPSNDTCAGAIPLTLDAPIEGTNAGALHDYRLQGGACFAGTGQLAASALGRDTVWSFTAPESADYSFRVRLAEHGGDLVPYLAASCPAAPPVRIVGDCLAAANRNTASTFPSAGEEIMCHPLAAGQTVFVFVDEVIDPRRGGRYTVEVNRCSREVEPNNTPATAGALSCGVEGSIAPAGDVDFYALGPAAAGFRLFALLDGLSSNSTDFDMRVTTSSSTIEYDDADNDAPFGVLSPNCAGTRLTGVPSFVRISHFSSAASAEPYRLYAVVQPDASAAAPEVEPNDALAQASVSPGGYFAGTISTIADRDFFRLTATAGDLVFASLDTDPLRDRTAFNGLLDLFDAAGNLLISVNGSGSNSSTATGDGSLEAMTPYSPGEALVWRATYSGAHYVRVRGGEAAGDYLLSITVNCQGVTGGSADLSVSKSGPSGSVAAGSEVSYSLTLANGGPDTALGPSLTDTLPPNASFVSITSPPGWSCDPSGQTIVCTAGSLAPGVPQSFTLVARVAPCAGEGASVVNTVTAASTTFDPDVSNNIADATNSVTDPGTCDDGNPCTTDDACSGGVCTGTPLACSDANPCTDDACDPASGCVFTNNAAPCDDADACTTDDACSGGACLGGPPLACSDANPCTDDACDPASGCVFTNNSAPCDDADACTTDDACSGGACLGGPPLACSDANPCTDDACDPASGCVFTNNSAPCDDADACTHSDLCAGGICGGTPFVTPSEVTGLSFLDKTTLAWTSAAAAGPGTLHDLVRGMVSQLPVGSGAAEICLASITAATAADTADPPADGSFWYLVRGRNCAGTGTYGFRREGGTPTTERVTAACP